ncbi:hypothetical protein PGQ11_012648 [Apiospora arundinis]|uniref:Uncharacterized protein n=1 Tax=Apiospora arundinis TaxID=335852 RepID=A0ABR2I315_9PEZI
MSSKTPSTSSLRQGPSYILYRDWYQWFLEEERASWIDDKAMDKLPPTCRANLSQISYRWLPIKYNFSGALSAYTPWGPPAQFPISNVDGYEQAVPELSKELNRYRRKCKGDLPSFWSPFITVYFVCEDEDPTDLSSVANYMATQLHELFKKACRGEKWAELIDVLGVHVCFYSGDTQGTAERVSDLVYCQDSQHQNNFILRKVTNAKPTKEWIDYLVKRGDEAVQQAALGFREDLEKRIHVSELFQSLSHNNDTARLESNEGTPAAGPYITSEERGFIGPPPSSPRDMAKVNIHTGQESNEMLLAVMPDSRIDIREGLSKDMWHLYHNLLTEDTIRSILNFAHGFLLSYPGVLIKVVKYKWFPMKRNLQGGLIVEDPSKKTSDYDKSNAAGCARFMPKESKKDLEKFYKKSGHDLPWLWGPFLTILVDIDDDKPEATIVAEQLTNYIHTHFFIFQKSAGKGTELNDLFGLHVQVDKSGKETHVYRPPATIYCPKANEPDLFILIDRKADLTLEDWAIGWLDLGTERFKQNSKYTKRATIGFNAHEALVIFVGQSKAQPGILASYCYRIKLRGRQLDMVIHEDPHTFDPSSHNITRVDPRDGHNRFDENGQTEHYEDGAGGGGGDSSRNKKLLSWHAEEGTEYDN